MESRAREALLAQRVRFVIGKGGVGKTTVSVAFALAGVRAGKQVLLMEMDPGGRAAALLGSTQRPGYEGRRTPPGVWVMAVDGRQSLEEYLALVVPARRVLKVVLHSQVYQYFVAAAPGLKELMAVGKVWYEAERRDADGRHRWDLIVVDAPATGHGLQYLRMPRAARDTFGAGLVRREAMRVETLLEDPRQTAIDLVTTAEEMPVAEAIETYGVLTTELRLPTGLLVVNRFHAGAGDADLVARLMKGAGRLSSAERLMATEVGRVAAEENSWAAINSEQLARLRAAVPLPTLVLPVIYSEEFGTADVAGLSDVMERRWTVPPDAHGPPPDRVST